MGNKLVEFKQFRITAKIFYLLSTGLFFFITLQRQVNWLRTISLLVQFRPYLALPVVAVLILMLTMMRNEKGKRAFLFFIITALFAFSLAGLWANTQTENFILAGLLPRSDASYQYAGALSLLDFGVLNETTTRRPFFAELFAFILAISNRNLQISLSIMSFLVAVGVWFCADVIEKKLDKGAAVIFIVLIHLYYLNIVGTTLTENLGLILGLFSLAGLTSSFEWITENQILAKLLFLLGIALFAMGQSARPGALFTLPLIILFSGWLFRGGKKYNVPFAGITSLSALIPFIGSEIHVMLNGVDGAISQSNLAYGLYGFVKGGLGWNQILIDYPGLTSLPMDEQIRLSFSYIISEVITNPVGLLVGYQKEITRLFQQNTENGFFSLVNFYSTTASALGSITFIVLFILTIVRLIVEKEKMNKVFLWIIVIGFFLSIPFAPPTQTQYMRVYATTMPYLFYLLVNGLNLVTKKIPLLFSKTRLGIKELTFQSATTGVFGLFILLLPLLLMVIDPKMPENPGLCSNDLPGSIVYYNPKSSIKIIEDDQIALDWAPIIHQSRFREMSHNICCEMNINFYSSLSAPLTVFTAINDSTGGKLYALVDIADLPPHASWLQICGQVKDNSGKLSISGFMHVEEVFIID